MGNLLVITFSGARYGVWEHAVSSVIGALPLHRLPLSPPAIAGIALLEDRSAVIADLGACLGLPPMKRPQNGTFLIIDAGDKIAGFGVEGELERFECPPNLILSIPPAAATSVADTCAVRGASLIPIINIGSLHERLRQGLLDLPSPEPGQPARAIDLSGVRSVRMFSVGGARFCVAADDTGYAELGEGGIAPVPVRSKRLAGVALHDGAVVPVMLPGALLGIGDQDGGKGMLLAGPRGGRYGVAVDRDLGVVEGGDLKALTLPVLAAKPWLPAAVHAQGKICLLVDFGLFEAFEEIAGERPILDVFKPASLFPARFRKIGAEVVEFSLLGARHAVPHEEMKEDLALLPFVPVPGTPEIVLGVAELRGELLPILDLAAIFGRRSPPGKKGRMMRIVNGDFQALVVTEEVAGSRRLPVETQRQVPIALPHQVLYGCYLDAGMVRLILNVEALAVHFEKASVRELVASLTPDIDEQTEQAHETLKQAPPVPPAAETGHGPGEAPRPDRDKDAVTVECATETAPAEAGDSALAAALDEERIREEARREATAEAAARELARQRVEAERLAAEDEARSRAAEQARLRAEADAKALEEKRLYEEAERVKAEEEERARAEAGAKAREQEAASGKTAEDAAKIAAEETRKREEEEARRKAEDLASEAAAVAARRAAEEAERQRAADEAKRQAAEALAKSRMMPGPPMDPRFSQGPRPGEGRPAARERGKRIGLASVIGLLLVLILYFVSMPKRPEPQGPSKPEATGKQAATRKNAPQPEKEPPLYLTVPPDKAVPDPSVYTVIKGDNLWNIAKRFTGNPLNYPRVAKDNSIATPDLIFPGQRIQIRNELAPGR